MVRWTRALVALGAATASCGWWGPAVEGPVATAASIMPPHPTPGDRPRCRGLGPGEAPGKDLEVTWLRNGVELVTSKDHRWPEDQVLRPGDVIGCRLGKVAPSGAALDTFTVVRPPAPDWLGANALILVADDLGVDKVGAYGVVDDVPATPFMDRLAEQGMLFERAYGNAICSPTRATLLTGRYAARSGVGTGVIVDQAGHDLSLEEITLPEALATAPTGYRSAAIGKWHLAGRASDLLRNPLDQGFEHFAGTVSNLSGAHTSDESEQSYLSWEKNTDGLLSRVTDYATTVTVDDALASMEAMPEPWLLYVAFHAPHAPLHKPPKPLLHRQLGEDPAKVDQFDAMVEALDDEIGRLLTQMGPELRGRTNIFLVGDNGTPAHGTRPPLDPERTKGTLFEGGVHVPLIVSGPAVASRGSRSRALVNTTDVFATIVELGGVELPLRRESGREVVSDGVSLVPYLREPGLGSLREYAYVESFSPNGCAPSACEHYKQALIGERYKLLRDEQGRERFDDLQGRLIEVDPEEKTPLTAEEDLVFKRMRAELTRLTAHLALDHTGG
jgi:arylsulfatase B